MSHEISRYEGVLQLPRIEYEEVLEIAPAEGNVRNSEGAFLTLQDGKILFAWTRYVVDDALDSSPSEIYAVLSGDNGMSWGKPFRFLGHDTDETPNLMCPNLILMNSGSIGLLYFRRSSAVKAQLCFRTTTDLGRTWSSGQVISRASGYDVVNNDRVVRLSSGRLIIPHAYHPSIEGKTAVDYRSAMAFYFSDDDGASWSKTDDYWLDVPHTSTGLQEPGVIELGDGRLYAWARTDLGTQYYTESSDEGKTWSTPKPSAFSSPPSPLSMKKDDAGNLLAVWNPVPLYTGRLTEDDLRWHAGRNHLVLAKFHESGGFRQAYLIEDRKDAAFAYTAIQPTDDGVLLAYCAGQKSLGDGNSLARIRMIKITQETLEGLL